MSGIHFVLLLGSLFCTFLIMLISIYVPSKGLDVVRHGATSLSFGSSIFHFASYHFCIFLFAFSFQTSLSLILTFFQNAKLCVKFFSLSPFRTAKKWSTGALFRVGIWWRLLSINVSSEIPKASLRETLSRALQVGPTRRVG